MNNKLSISGIILSLLLFTGCAKQPAQPQQPKYVFYLILDGCGVNTINCQEMYQAELQGKIGRVPTTLSQFPVAGVSSTYRVANRVTDSAASGTALATGVKTYNGAIGMDTDTVPVYGIASWAKAAGKRVGIGSSVCVNHATPAAQYAHQSSRNLYYEIGLDLAASGFDFFGGSDFTVARGLHSDRTPLHEVAADSGYTIARGWEDYSSKKTDADKMIFFQLQADSDIEPQNLPYWIDHREDQVTIVDVVRAQIDFLYSKDTEKKGFFLMNEIGGKIDYACHPNDGATAFAEVAAADSAVKLCYDFYLQHPDETLIVITADHETGGLTVGNERGHYTLHLKLLANQKCSDAAFTRKLQALRSETHNKVTWDQVKTLLTENFGFYEAVEISEDEDKMLKDVYKRSFVGKMENEKNLYYENEPMTGTAIRLLNSKASVGWTTTSHTAGLVPVFAIGVGAEKFSGYNDNASIPLTIADVAGYPVQQRR